MFEFIIGDLIDIKEEYIVLQNNNIGYRIYTSVQSMLDLDLGQENVLIYTELIVREDAMDIYGFTSQEELDMFKMLLKVSRIGPKVGLGVLSTLSPNKIKTAIVAEDSACLSKAPGIGKKTAERIILELKDKIDLDDIIVDDSDMETVIKGKSRQNEEAAIDALMGLGYMKYEIEKIFKDMDTEAMSVEDLIRISLKELSN